jgi:hypothetical protein
MEPDFNPDAFRFFCQALSLQTLVSLRVIDVVFPKHDWLIMFGNLPQLKSISVQGTSASAFYSALSRKMTPWERSLPCFSALRDLRIENWDLEEAADSRTILLDILDNTDT